jgi:FkbM family methyltransferase
MFATMDRCKRFPPPENSMSAKAVIGKLVQLRRARPSLWLPFLLGWYRRGSMGTVPCVIPGCQRLLQVPLLDFYECYRFFCEVPAGMQELDFILGQLREKETFYDIGGFRGAISAAVKSRLQSQVSVHVFEPLPKNLRVIEAVKNANHFSDFTISPLAVGKSSMVNGTINEHDAMLRAGGNQTSSNSAGIPAIALDEYIRQGAHQPTLIKVDVEGFELDVFLGAQTCLKEHHPRIWLEVHPEFLKAQGKSADDVLNLLRNFGYKIYPFTDSSGPNVNVSFHVWCS